NRRTPLPVRARPRQFQPAEIPTASCGLLTEAACDMPTMPPISQRSCTTAARRAHATHWVPPYDLQFPQAPTDVSTSARKAKWWCMACSPKLVTVGEKLSRSQMRLVSERAGTTSQVACE